MGKLVAISYSPWSEKARWALDHHQIVYRESAYLPMLGEPVLRLRLRRATGKLTVPIYFDNGHVLTDSLDIARHAEAHGRGEKLFPPGVAAEIVTWNEMSERAMHAGRALATNRVGNDPDAAEESLPVPKPLRSIMRPMAGLGVTYLTRKYRLDDVTQDEHRAQVRLALGAVREALGGRRKHLVGDDFSYADIAMAAAMQLVGAVEDRYIELGPHTRQCMHDDALNLEFPDIFEWRDWLYSTSR